MNHNTVKASTPESLPLCSNVTARGRRCRCSVTHPGSRFCRSHSRTRPRRQPEANPLADLPPELSAFNSYADITKFLARLLILLSENRITPRRAAVLSYIANSILNSLRAAERQTQYQANSEPEELRIDWTGVPRPERELQRFAGPQDSPPSDPPPVAQADPSAAPPAAQVHPDRRAAYREDGRAISDAIPEPAPNPSPNRSADQPPDTAIGGTVKPPTKYQSYWDQLKSGSQ